MTQWMVQMAKLVCPSYCLFFFDLRHIINSLGSSNCSWTKYTPFTTKWWLNYCKDIFTSAFIDNDWNDKTFMLQRERWYSSKSFTSNSTRMVNFLPDSDKWDDRLAIINFPFLGSNILTTPSYGVYISQNKIITHTRACSFQFSFRLLTPSSEYY
jgi:hypothetical protein